MSVLTPRRAALIAALVACAAYANAVLNGWAGDDPLVIPDNVRTHSVHAAFAAWFLPYWPPPWEGAGLYRPLTILTYGIEWSASGGRPWLFHLDNVLLHGLASAIAVGVALRWLPPLGALLAGLVFALHPVHVEAVSNVVGRAELLAAVALLGALLAARRYRHSESPGAARAWLAVSVGAVGVGLFSKEHAAIAVAVLALDQLLDPLPARRQAWTLYLAVLGVTVAWFYLWRSIVGDYVVSGATTALYGLSRAERISHMMPVQLDVVRLLVWPLNLTADYSPQTIPLRREWGGLAWLGLTLAASVIALGLALAKRAPPVAFGILLAAGSYAPTSNLLFTSGVVLAERALYLGVFAPALLAGWAASRLADRPYRRALWLAAAFVLAVFAVRTVTRTPYWKSATNTIIEDAGDHPENYREHIHLGGLFVSRRDTARALAEYLAAAALAENDPFTGQSIVRNAIALGRFRLAVREGVRVHRIAPDDPRTGRWLTEAYLAAGQADSAVAVALRDAVRRPFAVGLVRTYGLALAAAEAPSWRLLVAKTGDDWLSGRLVQAAARLDSLEPRLREARPTPSFCDDLAVIVTPIQALKPDLQARARRADGRPCHVASGEPASRAGR